jgi:alkylated DNA repair dioxygenase AlkB
MPQSLLDAGDVWIDEHFIDGHEELYERLVGSIAWDGRIRARLAASFGLPYNYSGIVWPEAPFPELLVPVLDLVSDAVGYRPNNCLAHYYPDGGSTMGFHSDATDDLEAGTGIAIVSLGAERPLTFRNLQDRAVRESYPMRGGSLFYMSPRMQVKWQHGILAQEEVEGGRISLTFRRMKA